MVKPKRGETRRDKPMSVTLPQLTPSPNLWPGSIEFATPTPMIAPISVCELDAGKPRYQVPRFHRIADRSSASTIARPAPTPLETSSSTGKSCMMPMATAMPPKNTPAKLQRPERTTATCGFNEFV